MITLEDTEYDLYVAALRQTAVELLRIYRGTIGMTEFEPLDVDAIGAWQRIVAGNESKTDLDLIRMRRVQ